MTEEKDIFIKVVSASTVEDALLHLDSMFKERCDMFVVGFGDEERIEGHIQITVVAWEYGKERLRYDV